MNGDLVSAFPDGRVELYAPATAPDVGCNGAIAFGFRVDDVEAASAGIAAAGGELLGGIDRVPDLDHACRHVRGVDGCVHGLDESRPQPR